MQIKKVILAIVVVLASFGLTHAQCNGKKCNIAGGQATVMINSLNVDESKQAVNLRVSNDGPSANFRLKVTLQVRYKRGVGASQYKDVYVYFNEMAQGYSTSKYEESYNTSYTWQYSSEWDEIDVSLKDCEFLGGTICK